MRRPNDVLVGISRYPTAAKRYGLCSLVIDDINKDPHPCCSWAEGCYTKQAADHKAATINQEYLEALEEVLCSETCSELNVGELE
jgi:hypothetical protein